MFCLHTPCIAIVYQMRTLDGSNDKGESFGRDAPKMRQIDRAPVESNERRRRSPVQIIVSEYRLARDSLKGVFRDIFEKNDDDY